MKVLQLCNKPPLPMIDGGCIAINNISTGLLTAGIELKILTVSTHKHPFLLESYPKDFIEKTKISGIFLDTRVNIIDAFSALVTSDSYNVSRFFSCDFDKKLIELLNETEFDIVHLESLFMTPYISTIRRNSKAKIVLRSHNLEHLIWERLANTVGNKAKKIYLKHLSVKLKKYEQKTINEVDGIATISNEDTKRFFQLKCKIPMITIPFGIDLKKYAVSDISREKQNKLFHIGAMNWVPNLEAMNWFLDDIWTSLSKLDVELHLAGREMPSSIIAQANEKLKVYNDVESAIDFMSANDIMIVPLLSGSGMRVKIIEAMALGKIVITTSVGAEGILCEHQINCMIADTPEEFVSAVKFIIKNDLKANQIKSAARKLVEDHYNNQNIIQNLVGFYNTIISSTNIL